MIRLKIGATKVVAGTWDIPQSKQQADKLVKLIKSRHDGVVKRRDLSGLVGDDELFDEADAEMDENPNMEGFIPIVSVVHWVLEMIAKHNKMPNSFRDDWSDEEKQYLQKALKPFENTRFNPKDKHV
jgi:hypothetical protein